MCPLVSVRNMLRSHFRWKEGQMRITSPMWLKSEEKKIKTKNIVSLFSALENTVLLKSIVELPNGDTIYDRHQLLRSLLPWPLALSSNRRAKYVKIFAVLLFTFTISSAMVCGCCEGTGKPQAQSTHAFYKYPIEF